MPLTRIVLADDHALMREGIRSVLDRIDWLQVVAQAHDGTEALRLIGQHQPDIALLDIVMPGLSGLEVCERLKATCPDIRVVILSMHATVDFIGQALRAGACGYVLKETAVTELEPALRAVMLGQTFLSPPASTHLANSYVQQPSALAKPEELLTPRQLQILCAISRGLSTKEIAFELHLSAKTVESHRMQMMNRLRLRDVASLVRYAIRTGLAPLDLPAVAGSSPLPH
jgi:DNA-binding NarL/FixJ family response regulator